ncbi:MAG: hypothetical protein EXS37_05385 [Opitutus sp.]|nr:hypothetical protein [Opitutus sp.]
MITKRKRHLVSVTAACVWGAWALATFVPAASAAERTERRRDRDTTGTAPAKGATPATSPAPAVISPANSFDAFQLVVERNIFDPNRIGRTKAAPPEKPPRVDEISLVGTMNYQKGLVAFFDSPNGNYRKTLREGESVADFKVERIAADGVELLRAEKPVSLKVAQQLRRVENGEWTVRATPEPVAGADGRGSGGASGTFRPVEAPAITEIPADASEALKRLMEKRKKDLK